MLLMRFYLFIFNVGFRVYLTGLEFKSCLYVCEYLSQRKMFDNPSVTSSLLNFCLQCVDCLQIFQTKKDADEHIEKNMCVRKISQGAVCSVCDSTFEEVEKCLLHLQTCIKRRGDYAPKFKCSRCKKLYMSKYSCMKHIKSKKCNIEPSKTVYQCDNCSLEFTKKCALLRHINQNVCTNQKNQKCFVENCFTFFRKSEHLAEHIRIVHGNNIIFEGSGKKWEVENLKFINTNEFQQWLISVSNDYNCNYFTSVVKKINNVTYTNYKCQYDKKKLLNKYSSPNRKSLPNLKCPSQICCKTIDGQVIVTYYKTHNHEALNLKRSRIDYSRKMRPPSETVQHFIETANFSDDVLHMDHINNENSVRAECNNLVDNKCTHIQDSECSEIQDENNRHLTEDTSHMETTLGNENEPKDTDIFEQSTVDKNKADEDIIEQKKINEHEKENHCHVDVAYFNRTLKYDISELFSNILEYVESTDHNDLLFRVKSQLNNVLNECKKDAEL